MMNRREGVQLSLFTTTLEEIVPQDHFLRKLYAVVSFDFIYEELKPYYVEVCIVFYNCTLTSEGVNIPP